MIEQYVHDGLYVMIVDLVECKQGCVSLQVGIELMIDFYSGASYLDAPISTWNSGRTIYYFEDRETRIHHVWLFLNWMP